MDETALRQLFQRLLLAGVLAPASAAGAGCSDASGEGVAASDASEATTMVGRGDAETVDVVTDTPSPPDSSSPTDSASSTDSAATDAARDTEPGMAPDGGYTCTPDTSQCSYFVPLSCIDGGVVSDASYFGGAECVAWCANPAAPSCQEAVMPGGVSGIECYACASGGRRPTGFRVRDLVQGPCASEAGRYFARLADLEAASVLAFLAVHEELTTHGAPLRLRSAARRAARDEVRHARTMAALARRRHARVAAPTRSRSKERSLEAFAVENAVEGCVRETFGALLATFAATTATAADVRAAMRRIAVDETQHAALSWGVDAWVRARLDPSARARLDAAMRSAVRGLAREARTEPSATLRAHAGLPDAATAGRLLAGLDAGLWGKRNAVFREKSPRGPRL
jgi:hypothetical protein